MILTALRAQKKWLQLCQNVIIKKLALRVNRSYLSYEMLRPITHCARMQFNQRYLHSTPSWYCLVLFVFFEPWRHDVTEEKRHASMRMLKDVDDVGFPSICPTCLLYYSNDLLALTLYHSLGKFSRRQTWYFPYFPRKIGFGISCKLTPKETICMKCQNLLSDKKWEKHSKMSSADFLPSMLRVYYNDVPKHEERSLIA